jgi:hypothetical protein
MIGINLREFEELVLLPIAALKEEACGCGELFKRFGRSVKRAVLNCHEGKGLAESKLGEATKKREDKRKRFYQLNFPAKVALVRAMFLRDRLWDRIPSSVWKNT